jgi:hypothetical protein
MLNFVNKSEFTLTMLTVSLESLHTKSRLRFGAMHDDSQIALRLRLTTNHLQPTTNEDFLND